MTEMSVILLSTEQKQKLLALSKSATEPIMRRVRLILAYADGKPTIQAATHAGISRGRARFWKRQFLSRGMDIFYINSVSEKPAEEPIHSTTTPSEALQMSHPSPQEGGEKSPVWEEIPYPTPQKAIGINPDDSLAETGRKVWLYHFALMLSHERGTLLGEEIEELHDMRVATRRMRSAFDIFGQAFDPKIMKRFLKRLRTIGRGLGQVRDMDVILENALMYQGELEKQANPGLDALLDSWKHSIDQKRSRLAKHMKSEAYECFKQDFNRFLHTVEIEPASSEWQYSLGPHVRDIVPVLIYSRYAGVRTYDTILPIATVSQLHALRIEFKKLRYALEYFREILGEQASQAINELKQYQDHLGELHDADVACQLVRSYLKGWENNQTNQPIKERINPEPIVTYLAYLHAKRYRLMITFPELWQNFSRSEFRQNLAQAISLL